MIRIYANMFENQKRDDSRKGAKSAKFGEKELLFFFRSWRLGARNFLEVVLFKIQKVSP